MKNNYQEFFLSSNPKEIEQAKKKRSALISLFPKRLGEKDETTYVLLNDYNSSSGVFKSKNYKEQQNKQTLKVPQANERKPVHDTKVAPAANDSLKIDSTKAYSNPPQIGSNIAYITGLENNKPGINDTKQSENKLNLYFGETGDRYTHIVNKLKAKLPKGVQNVLKELGTEIRVGYNLHTLDKDSVRTDRNGIYNLNKITLDSKHVDFETLFAEAMHAVQDYLGILGYSNAEFQEHVAKDMYFRHIGVGHTISTTWDEDGKFSKFMDNSFTSKANDTIDINRFLEEVPNQIEGFKERYKNYPKYSSNFKDDFNYNWIDLFNILGIPLKFK